MKTTCEHLVQLQLNGENQGIKILNACSRIVHKVTISTL